MLPYKRMVRASWTEYKTDEEILNMTNKKRLLMKYILKQNCQYFQYIQRTTLEVVIGGKRQRGQLKVIWMDNFKDWTKISRY